MTNKEILIKKIIYRSTHRGSKEMDLLLGSFVKKYINDFNIDDLENLQQLLNTDDETLYHWFFDKKKSENIPAHKVSSMLNKFKL